MCSTFTRAKALSRASRALLSAFSCKTHPVHWKTPRSMPPCKASQTLLYSNAALIYVSERNIMTLTKAELADLLFEKVGLNKREAKDMVEGFFEEIRTALEAGDSVKLSGFGNFQLRPAVL